MFKSFLLKIIICFSIINTCSCQEDKKNSFLISAVEFNKQINSISSPILIDLRTPEEYDNGHINKAINLNYFDANFSAQCQKLDPKKTTYIYCQSGGRSHKASLILKQLGFKKIIDLKGGINAWEGNKLPLVK